jgi:cytochrome c556
MIRIVFVLGALALGIGFALAQEDPIVARKVLMKANGEAAKTGADMLKGQVPFDLDKARKVFATFEEAGTKAPALFPESSRAGDTAADPKIWENFPDFKARLEKLGADAKAAGAQVTDLATFKAAFGAIGKNDCGGCHEAYRVKKS